MYKKKNESGQSILIIALIVMVLLALVALVVDVGNAYAHRRMVQNAVDAAALAGARQLAFRETRDPDDPVLVIQVNKQIGDFAEANGLDRDAVEAVFVKANGEWVRKIDNSPVPVPKQAEGVAVVGDLPFDTYFAHLLGFSTMQATADSAAYVLSGPCNGNCLFPVIVSCDVFDGPGPYCQPETEVEYKLWQQTLLTPGNFGWLYWVDDSGNMRGTPPQGPEVTSLEHNLSLDECNSGPWNEEDWVHGDNGVNFQPVLDLLEQYVESDPPITVTIPIYYELKGEGNNSLFHIKGFGAFQLLCAHSSRAHYVGDCGPDANKDNDKYLTGKFVKWMESTGFEDGCIDTGTWTVSYRPPKSGWMPEWTEDDDD